MHKDRVVIITGAGKGLGAAFARRIAADGAKVVVNNRIRQGHADSAGKIVAEIKAAGGDAVVDHCDVADAGASHTLVECALSAFGRIDAVVFNAGVNGDAARFAEMPEDAFDTVLKINFAAPVSLARAVWPHLTAGGAGRMLFISSSAGLYGVRGRAPYAASKGAINAFAATLAHEGRRAGIGVNMLMPYAFTQMTADIGEEDVAARLAPEKVAPLASWLVSKDCNGVGEFWVAGGGYVRKARILETTGAMFSGDIDSFLHANEGALDAVTQEQPFAGAEAAFGDLMARLR